MEKIKHNKKFIKLFILNFIIILCCYSSMLFDHFGNDSYAVYEDVDGYAALVAGRLVFWLFFELCNLIGFNPVQNQIYTTLFLIITLAYFTTTLVNHFNDKVNKENNFWIFALCEISFLIGVVNVFVLEWFLFPEVDLIYSLSLLGGLWSINESTNSDKRTIVAVIALFFTLNCYEAAFPIFLIVVMLDLVVESNFRVSIDSVKSLMRYLFISGTAAVLKILELKIIKSLGFVRSDFVSGFNAELIWRNMIEIINSQIELWTNAFGFLPNNICIVVGLFLLLLLINCFKTLKLSLIDIIYMLIIFCGCYISIFVLKIFNTPIWLAPRSIVGFFMFFSIVAVVVASLNKSSLKLEKSLLIVLSLFLFVNFIQIQDISHNHYKKTACDYYEAIAINTYIEKYEIENNTLITKIATKLDSNPTWTFPIIDYSRFDTNVRAFAKEWNDVTCLNYYTNRAYKKVEFIEELYPDGYDWNELNLDEQLKFVDDTAYLIIY